MLLADDDVDVRRILYEFLTGDGHTIITDGSGREALEQFATGSLDVVIVDRAMPGMSGDAVAAAIKSDGAQLPIIMLTG